MPDEDCEDREPGGDEGAPDGLREHGEADHDPHEPERVEDRAREIEPLPPALGPLALQFQEDEQDDRDPDRDVDPEDGPPPEVLGQQPAEEWADHEPEVDGRDVEAERTPPLLFRDHRGQDGEGCPEDHGAPGALDHPDRDHGGRGRDQGLRQGREGEDGDPKEEALLPAVDVGEPAEGDDEEG